MGAGVMTNDLEEAMERRNHQFQLASAFWFVAVEKDSP